MDAANYAAPVNLSLYFSGSGMKVFISHTNEDAQIAKKIRNHLAHSDIDVFDDKADISMGSNFRYV